MTGADDPVTTRTTASRLRSRSVLLGVLLAVILGCVITLTYLVATRTEESGSIVDRAGEVFREADDPSLDLQADREAVMAQTSQFALRVNEYGPAGLNEDGQLPEYSELVREVITPNFSTSFDESLTLNEQVVAQSGVARTGEVIATGVSEIDEDSASVLVAGTFTNSFPDAESSEERVNARPAQFRWEVSLVKIEGEWLVDNFVSVTGEPEEETGLPEELAPSPEPAPSEAPSPEEEPAP